MHSNRPSPRSGRARSVVRLALIGLVSIVAAGLATAGCLNRPLCDKDCRPATTNVFVDDIQQQSVDKIDLLFMIDNSISMADKQEVLAKAVPDLVRRLVNPVCINEQTGETAAMQPANPDDPCPDGFQREFNAVNDIHIGVISSSLGGHGGDLCTNIEQNEQKNDEALLLGVRQRARDAGIATNEFGFLAWGAGVNLQDLNNNFSALVREVGEQGCGFEASLEAWYRFLADPAPPQDVQVSPCGGGGGSPCASPVGVNQAVLDQRTAFLRPDSLVAIIMLSDENDCSIQNTGQLYYAARQDITLPRASSVCATNPNDPCCYSCGIGPGPECANPPDDCSNPELPSELDEVNLRCFDQERRFGISFLYPTSRYVNALSSFQLCTSRADLDASTPQNCPDNNGDGQPDIVPNPLFQDLTGAGGTGRDPALIFLAGIVGVPWQDIATPETLNTEPGQELEYMTAPQIAANGVWDVILGQPEASPPAPPADSLMVESIDPRGGSNPVLGVDLQPPGAPRMANPINGHEWTNTAQDDLQYACIMPLEKPRDCSEATLDAIEEQTGFRPGCDCDPTKTSPDDKTPLCQAPDGSYGTTQYFAKAYPGIRHLQVLKGFGDNSIVASICARNVTNPNGADFGYRPAIGAIVDRLKEALSGRCLPRELTVNDNGTPDDTSDDSVPCSIVEAIPQAGQPCDQNNNRTNVNDEGIIEASFRRLELAGRCGADIGRPCNSSSWTLCEILPARADNNGDGKIDCRWEENAQDVGWCYVDPDNGVGAQALVADCPPTERRLLKFVDPENNTPVKGSTALIACLGAELQEDPKNTGAINAANGGATGGMMMMNGGMTTTNGGAAGGTTTGTMNGGTATDSGAPAPAPGDGGL